MKGVVCGPGLSKGVESTGVPGLGCRRHEVRYCFAKSWMIIAFTGGSCIIASRENREDGISLSGCRGKSRNESLSQALSDTSQSAVYNSDLLLFLDLDTTYT
ncbi:hypothetical protein Tco_0178625 [Tanacetum coccineum]